MTPAATWSPLASVAVVCRSCPAVAALRHVVEAIDAYLDVSRSWSIGAASRFDSVRLLDRVAAREAATAVNGKRHRQQQFAIGMKTVAKSGSAAVAQWLCAYFREGRVPTEVVTLLAGNGHLEVLAWLFDNHDNVYWGGDEMHYAVTNDRFEVVKWLQYHTTPPNEDSFLLDEAARHGNLAMMQWLHRERGDRVTYDGAMRAANNGYLDVVQWLCCSFDFLEPRDFNMDKTAGNGHIGVLQWLHDNGAWCTSQAMNRAARNGHLDVVQWLHEYRKEGCSTDAMDYAAANGHLDVVQWLNENRAEGCTHFAMDMAAKNGYLAVVQWLHYNRSEGCTKRAMDDAAANGHMDVLSWLHEHRSEGCSVAAVEGATQYSHWGVVQWLHQAYPGQFVPGV